MIPYNPTHTPPAPALSVYLTHTIRSRPRIELPALIDTGADATAIPLDAIDRLKLYQLRRWVIEEASGTETYVNSYAVRLAIVGQEAKDIEVIPIALPLVILGRDWLADYYLYLNGPSQTFHLSVTPLLPE